MNTERFVLILAPQAERTASARLGITASRKIGGAFAHEKGDQPVRRKAGTAATRDGKAAALRRVK